MAKRNSNDRPAAHRCCEKPCWQELLQDALHGALPADQCLEPMLDHLGRTQ